MSDPSEQPPAASQASNNPNESWRNYTNTTPIRTCKLRTEDFKRIYRILTEKQSEYAEKSIIPKLFQTESETLDQFNERIRNVRNSFVVTVRVVGANGDEVTGHGESFFDSSLLPGRFMSIFYDTSFSPLAKFKHTPADRATLLLDFSKPSLLNYGALPSAPTPNNSNFFIVAETESWASALTKRLRDFSQSVKRE